MWSHTFAQIFRGAVWALESGLFWGKQILHQCYLHQETTIYFQKKKGTLNKWINNKRKLMDIYVGTQYKWTYIDIYIFIYIFGTAGWHGIIGRISSECPVSTKALKIEGCSDFNNCNVASDMFVFGSYTVVVVANFSTKRSVSFLSERVTLGYLSPSRTSPTKKSSA